MIRAALAALLIATPLCAQRIVRSENYIVYSWTTTDRLAQRVLEHIAQYDSFPGMPAAAPSFGQPIHIYLAPNDRVFREVTGGLAPEWGVGVAAPAQGIIALRAYGGQRGAFEELRSVLHHELAHIALHRYLEPARVPRWFNEGYAVWSSGELDMEAGWMLRVAFATDRAPPLDSLELSWPAMATDARVAYLLAASVVQYLVRESGTRGLEVFMRRWHDAHSFERALASTYGLSIDQLELHWRKDVKRRYGWLSVMTQTSVAFTLMAIAVLGLFLIRRRRDRAKLEQLKANELPDEPAFWNGIDPDPPVTDIDDNGQANNENDRPA
jgi:hypothetical protein